MTNSKFIKRLVRQRELVLMALPLAVYALIFAYVPLKGWIMAFQNYRPGRDVQPWVGLENFKFLFFDNQFLQVLRNTLGMSTINLILNTAASILFALLLNEIRHKIFKSAVQTISYLPHFFSWVIACALIGDFLATDGLLNHLLVSFGILDSPFIFLADKKAFWWIVGWSNVWKEVGWNSIIYLAAITAIDTELYESASLDGAGRFNRMLHITLPGIKSTILVILIMNIGWILNAGFEIQYLLGNGVVQDVSETIDIFVIKYGISLGYYSLATAAGMFKTVVSIVLISAANFASRRFAEESLV